MRLVFEQEKEKGCARDEQVHNLNYPLQGTIRIIHGNRVKSYKYLLLL